MPRGYQPGGVTKNRLSLQKAVFTRLPQEMPEVLRRVPFPDSSAGRVFNIKFRELVRELLRRIVEERIPPENSHTFYHGHEWTQRRDDGSELTAGVQAHTAESQLRFEDVVSGRLSAIVEQARAIVEQMEAAFMRTLYETVSSAVEEVGNVVDAKDKPPPTAFLEVLRKIEFGVDRKGQVTRPQMHMHPDIAPKFVKALEDAGPEFEAEVNRLTAKKEAEALAREAQRKARFRKRMEDA